MNTVTVSAPGKLLLLGDHAVVYNRPCLVTAVGQRMQATVSLVDEHTLSLEAPEVGIYGYRKALKDLGGDTIPKNVQFIENVVHNFNKRYPLSKGVIIRTKSDFSSTFGFGSSSAVTVCVLKAISQLCGQRLDNKSLFKLAYQTILDVQGVGSGFDIAAAIYGGILYFVGGGEKIEQLSVKKISLIVGYSGVKADTPSLVRSVAAQMKTAPALYQQLFDSSTYCVEEGRKSIVDRDFESFGRMMNYNEGLLASMGVETGMLSAMIYVARDAGAYGAKLSGAGGGDCMIAVAPPEKVSDVKAAITKVGGQIIEVTTNVQGVLLV
ncbi:MAG: mevalonate kinase [Candidatus Levyibacteriota bacterium]